MSSHFELGDSDEFQGASEFSFGVECSHQDELGPHYHMEIERQASSKGVGYADVAISLSPEQVRVLWLDLGKFLNSIT